MTNWIDQRDVPEWGNGPDGRFVKIVGDEIAATQHAEWAKLACQHENCVVVLRPDSAGRKQFYRYCEECGIRLGGAIAHSAVVGTSDKSPEWFENRNREYQDLRRHAFDRIANEAAARQQQRNRDDYSTYLASPEWRRRREKVMHRANGICEGCLTNQATEVHHRTYDHIGNEFAFELIALCDHCHSRLHGYAA